MVMRWKQKDFCQYLQQKIFSRHFNFVTQNIKKFRFQGRGHFFKIQMTVKSLLFNIETWNFQIHLVRPISLLFVFYSKRFEQNLKFRKSRNLTFRARSFNMVWQTKFLLSSKFTFGSNINLGTHLNFVSQAFKCNITLSKNVGHIVPPPGADRVNMMKI